MIDCIYVKYINLAVKSDTCIFNIEFLNFQKFGTVRTPRTTGHSFVTPGHLLATTGYSLVTTGNSLVTTGNSLVTSGHLLVTTGQFG